MIVTTKGEAVCDVFPIVLKGLIWSITTKTWRDEQFIYEDESTKAKEVVKMVTQLDGYANDTLLRKEMAIFLEVEHPEIKFVRGEQVNSPSHYNQCSKEVWQMMIDLYGKEKFLAFCELNAFKYRMRAGYKGDANEDIEKAKWYESKMKEI